ncbi:MAG: thermonuclease family protein [Candidatus Omnitrophica bacterium]|nr:thermonuclease family protein [Candidatus Omnitrophota bacterium]
MPSPAATHPSAGPTRAADGARAPTLAPDAALADYARLKAAVRETLILGQQRIEAARVTTYWRTGWAIRAHLALQGSRSEHYGTQLVERLGRDLAVDVTVLRRCVQFAERLPDLLAAGEIRATWRESLPSAAAGAAGVAPLLTWSHYRALIAVADPRRRETLLKQATRQEWPVAELEARIRREAARSDRTDGAPPQPVLAPLRGTPGLYQIKDLSGALYWDLGFESYRELSPAQARSFKAGDLVRLTSAGALESAPDATPAQLYTYEARLLRVVDGDTCWLLIRLAGADWRKEKLRLRGIDCPELTTQAGQTAKRYVESQCRRATQILITTTKPDQWDRYLSDVFLTLAGQQVFLNTRLLELSHARLYTTVSPEDWETDPGK